MERNLDLIRDLLFLTEAQPAGQPVQDYTSLAHFGNEVVIEHIDLAIKGNLLEGQVVRGLGGQAFANINRLTNSGHDLLAQIKSQGVWERVKSEAKKQGAEMTIHFVKVAAHAAYEVTIAAVKARIQGGS